MNKIPFHDNWFFRKWEQIEPTAVTLPHDAMQWEDRDPACRNAQSTGYFPGGKYVYTKSFYVPDAWKNSEIILEFEGVYQNAEVYLNGEKVASWPYGYSNFYVSLTNKLLINASNEITVIADNSGEPCTRWYCGSGIYRPVWLYVGEHAHIVPDGVRIQTKSHSPAVLNVKTQNTGGEVSVNIFDGDEIVASGIGEDVDVEIPDAKLWSAETPYLYTCRVDLKENGEVVDSVTVRCGICHIQWSTKGLYINGTETKLRGACIHHDNGILGACEYLDAAMRRARILKEAGFNAIRSAHNPISKAMLNACDQLGLYVMDEFVDMWYEHKNRWDYASYFETWYQRDLAAMVKKDFSHPCVIMYSIGNEVTETGEEWGIRLTKEMTELVHDLDLSRPVTCGINMALNTMHFAGLGVYRPEPDEPSRRDQPKNPKALALLAQMTQNSQTRAYRDAASEAGGNSESAGNAALGVREDMGVRKDGKLVGSECFNEAMKSMKERQRMVVTQPIAKVLSEDAYAALDIAGYNYADGRYELDAVEYPDRISVGSESLPQRIYKNWGLVKKLPYLLGDFIWTGWDYLGEAGIGTFCYDSIGSKDKEFPALLAGCGVIDITGQMRPEVWWNKIVYGLEKGPYIGVEPVIHADENHLISAWRYSDAIHSWSWRGCEGKTAQVLVYANAATVELWINGVSVGVQPVTEYQASFAVVYEPGVMEAISYDENGNVIGKDSLVTAGDETILSVRMDKAKLAANGQELCYLDIYLADSSGIVKSSEDCEITISVSGVGQLVALGSADPFNTESFHKMSHKTYYGHVQAIVSATAPGLIQIDLGAPNCDKQSVTISAE